MQTRGLSHTGNTKTYINACDPISNLWSMVCPKACPNLGEIDDQQAMIVLSMVDINGLIGMR